MARHPRHVAGRQRGFFGTGKRLRSADRCHARRQRAGHARPGAPIDMLDILAQRSIRPQRACKRRRDQHKAFGHRAVIGRHIQRQQDVDHDHQCIGTDHRTYSAAASPGQRGAAQNDGGECLQQQGIANQRIGGAGLGADEDSGSPVKKAAERESPEFGPGHREASRPGSFGIAADRVKRRAERPVLDHQPYGQTSQNQQHRRGQHGSNRRSRQQRRQPGGDMATRIGQNQQRQSAHQKHRRQRHDNRLQAEIGDEETIESAHRRTRCQPGQHGQNLRGEGILRQGRYSGIDQRNRCAGRKIKAAGNDDQGLADGGQRQRRAAIGQGIEIEIVQAIRRQRAEAEDRQSENQRNRHQPAMAHRQRQAKTGGFAVLRQVRHAAPRHEPVSRWSRPALHG